MPSESTLLLPAFDTSYESVCTQQAIWKAVDPNRNFDAICRRPPIPAGKSGARFHALDGLRALAYVWVVAFHCRLHGIALVSTDLTLGSLGIVLGSFINWGEGGVTLFLVLSGS